MTTPVGVQRSRARGWRMPDDTAYVGRPGPFGNPFGIEDCIALGYAKDRATAQAWCVEQYEILLARGSADTAWGYSDDLERCRRVILAGLPWLRGKNLACWCALDAPCHRNPLLRMANGPIPATVAA